MTVSDNFLYVSTSHDSHLCFRISRLSEPEDETTFHFISFFSDSRQRPSLRHLSYSYPLVDTIHSDKHGQATILLLTDKNASVTGLIQPLPSWTTTTATTIFEACLPRSVIRIQRGDVRPPWRRKHTTSQIARRPLGVIDDDFLGACTDGTIYNFATLQEQALYLLRFIQNIVEEKRKRDPELRLNTINRPTLYIHEFLRSGPIGSQDGDIRARDVDPEMQTRGAGAPRFRHVDGDILNDFIEKRGNMKDLVTEGCEHDVEKMFLEKAAWLGERSDAVGERETMFSLVEEWVKELLIPLL